MMDNNKELNNQPMQYVQNFHAWNEPTARV